jgi:hypothetical protein
MEMGAKDDVVGARQKLAERRVAAQIAADDQ